MDETARLHAILPDDIVVNGLGVTWLHNRCAYHFAAHLPVEHSPRVMQALNSKFRDVTSLDRYKMDKQGEVQKTVMKMLVRGVIESEKKAKEAKESRFSALFRLIKKL